MLDMPLKNKGGSGPRLILAVVGWLVVVAIAIGAIWWGFFAPSPAEETETPNETITAPTPTATAPSGLIPLETVMPEVEPGATPQPGDDTTSPPGGEETTVETFGYGIAADALPLPDYTAGQIGSLGLGWIKQQVRWEDFEPGPGEMDWSGYDAVVEAANSHGLKVMLSVVGAPDWTRTYFDSNPEAAPPDDLSLFAEFLGRLVDRYQGRVHAIEVWNEQNLDREWDTAEGVDPVRYVEMLRLAYQVIKSRDPNIIVISGALSPVGGTATDPNDPSRIGYMDDYQYYQEMIANGFLNYCDCVGVHHNGYNIPPHVAWDDDYQDDTATFRGFWDNPHPSWSFRSTLWRYTDAIDGMKPLCITEFGWASAEGLGGHPPGFGFALDNTLEEQAQYDTQAFQLMREWGFVRLAFLWNLNYANTGPRTPDDPNAPYSIIDYNGVARPAFDAVRTMEKP